MKRYLLPALLLAHESLLIVLPLLPVLYRLLTMPSLYDGTAAARVLEHGGWHTAVVTCFAATALLQLVLIGLRLSAALRSFRGMLVRTLAARYCFLIVAAAVVIDLNTAATGALASFSRNDSDAPSAKISKATSNVEGRTNELWVRADGSVGVSAAPYLTPTWPVALYLVLGALLWNRGAAERRAVKQLDEAAR